jgi:addiction module HigA family antidote
MRKVPYPHPGEILLEEFLKPMGITQYRLAKEIGVPQRRIGEIVAGARAVTADTGLRLSRFFGLRGRQGQRFPGQNTRRDQAMEP